MGCFNWPAPDVNTGRALVNEWLIKTKHCAKGPALGPIYPTPGLLVYNKPILATTANAMQALAICISGPPRLSNLQNSIAIFHGG